jgi:hypothetical protein
MNREIKIDFDLMNGMPITPMTVKATVNPDGAIVPFQFILDHYDQSMYFSEMQANPHFEERVIEQLQDQLRKEAQGSKKAKA